MPGEQYTVADLAAMSEEDLRAAQANGFAKPSGPHGVNLHSGLTTVQDMTPSQINLGSAANRPAADPQAWSKRKTERTSDFTVPSGQTCKLRRLTPEKLLEAGLLDKVTRLEGLANTLVEQAEGAPPSARKMPTRSELAALIETVNAFVPLAVVDPKVWEDGDEKAPDDAIFISDIDLEDRLAIMEEALKGIKALDRFRQS